MGLSIETADLKRQQERDSGITEAQLTPFPYDDIVLDMFAIQFGAQSNTFAVAAWLNVPTAHFVVIRRSIN